MNWTPEKLAEALEIIDAIHKSMITTQRAMEEMVMMLKQTKETADRINAQFTLQMTVLESPSICPKLTSQ